MLQVLRYLAAGAEAEVVVQPSPSLAVPSEITQVIMEIFLLAFPEPRQTTIFQVTGRASLLLQKVLR